MEIVVKSTTRESKQAQGKTYWGVKHEDNNWYNLINHSKPAIGARFNVEVKETQFNGRTYRWANIVQGQQAVGTANGHIPWGDYRHMAEIAHEMAKGMEPDDAAARAAILNTVMIAFSNGRVALPKDDPEEGPPLDDNIPF